MIPDASGKFPFRQSDISMLFSGQPARIPEPAIIVKTGSTEMSDKLNQKLQNRITF
jgi:hypothetical protein